jgi:two-component system, OmpR family, sensor histidine kinase VicK
VLATLRLLLIEDSADDAELLLFELQHAGYDVSYTRVETAVAMQAALKQQAWDIVLSDYSMPLFSGEAALKILQQSGSDIPFIVVSGAIGEESAVEIMRAGAHDYVMKDKPQRLIPAIQREMREAAERRARREAEKQRTQLQAELRQYADKLEQMVEERTKQLRQAKEEIELVLDNTTDAIVLAQPNGDIRAKNIAFMRVFGERVVGNIERILWTLIGDDYVTAMCNALVDVMTTGQPQRVEARIETTAGNTQDAEIAFVPVRLGDDQRASILISVHDITHIKEIERFKERFVLDAVHDLATPISGLSTRLYLLKRSPEQLGEHLNALENQVRHLRNLLNDLRTMSQLDRGQLALQLEPYDLNELAYRVFDTYEPIAISKQQTLTLSTDDQLPTIQLDSRRMERVLVNLIANAINYTPEGKAIHAWTQLIQTSTGPQVCFAVRDEGIGIAEAEIERIFERFYRTTTARQTHDGGTGLGLAITQEIVHLHGGTIDVESTPGTGSVFTVRLPIDAGPMSTV